MATNIKVSLCKDTVATLKIIDAYSRIVYDITAYFIHPLILLGCTLKYSDFTISQDFSHWPKIM